MLRPLVACAGSSIFPPGFRKYGSQIFPAIARNEVPVVLISPSLSPSPTPPLLFRAADVGIVSQDEDNRRALACRGSSAGSRRRCHLCGKTRGRGAAAGGGGSSVAIRENDRKQADAQLGIIGEEAP